MRFAWLLAALWIWTGCDSLTFSPDSAVPATEVDPTPGVLSLDFTATEDTLGLWGTVELTYDLTALGAGPVDSVQLTIGDRVLPQTSEGSVSLQTTEFPDGEYSLELTAYASSGTRSLADVYGHEPVTTTVTRAAVIENAPPEPVVLQSVMPKDGLLTLRWNRYPRRNFQAYRIYRSNADGSNPRPPITILARDSTSWADPTFIGGSARYEVEVVAGDGRTARDSHLTSETYPPPELIRSSGDPSGDIELAWTGTRFPGALDRYEIYETGNAAPLFATQDTTSSLALPNTFGTAYRFRLVTRGRALGDNEGDTFETEEVEVTLDSLSGFTSALSADVFAVPGQHAVYGLDALSGQPVLRDLSTLAVLAEASLPPNAVILDTPASSNGRLGVLFGQGNDLYAALLNTTTLATERVVALDPLVGGVTRTAFDTEDTPQLTDDGVLFFRLNPQTLSVYNGPMVLGVDLATGTRVAAFDDRGRGTEPLTARAVSPDGRYLVLNDVEFGPFYERNPDDPEGYTALEPRQRHEGDLRAAAFVSATEVAVVGMSSTNPFMNEEVLILDLEAGFSFASIPVTPADSPELVYDPVSGRLAYTSDQNDGTFQTLIHLFLPEISTPVSIVTSTFERGHGFAAGVLWNGGRYRRLFD